MNPIPQQAAGYSAKQKMAEHKIFITGGAGFIGSHIAEHYLTKNIRVTVFDNLSRKGTEKNLLYLKKHWNSKLTFIKGDIRSPSRIRRAIPGHSVVFHTAAQVAVTTSVVNPREDFEINALGTFNVLDAVRRLQSKPVVCFTSTNKVYGKMDDVSVVEKKTRYQYKNKPRGISETQLLDFYSPYGCSKGAAEQYVRDFGRIYNIPCIVFRMSCIYGTRQYGTEDQGWVAHFILSTLRGIPLTVYGDGKQVRDILFVDDLVLAFDKALRNISKTSGNIYNIGGGPRNTLSLLELIAILQRTLKKKVPVSYSHWRPGDQKVYVSDIRKAKKRFKWKPENSPEAGIQKLLEWASAASGDDAVK